MDKRSTHSLTGTVDAHPVPLPGAEARGERATPDGADTNHGPDLKRVLQAIAARIDVVLDEKVAAGAEPEHRHRAARAWSSVVGKRATDESSDLRRHALATTVFRFSSDGRLDDVGDRRAGAIDAAAPAASRDAGRHAAAEPAEDAEAGRAESGGAHDDRQPDAGRPVARPEEAQATSEAVAVEPAHDVTSEPRTSTVIDRSDVEERLSAVRERLATRRASAMAARVDTPDARAPRNRVPLWRRAETRTVVQRLLIGLAIVGASAVVSILIA